MQEIQQTKTSPDTSPPEQRPYPTLNTDRCRSPDSFYNSVPSPRDVRNPGVSSPGAGQATEMVWSVHTSESKGVFLCMCVCVCVVVVVGGAVFCLCLFLIKCGVFFACVRLYCCVDECLTARQIRQGISAHAYMKMHACMHPQQHRLRL